MGEKSEEIKKYKLLVTEYLWDVKYSISDRVAKENICMTHGHGQWCGDCLREWDFGWKGTKVEKLGQL